ncbi:MAG: hypothetical protein LBJ23_08810 [Tannerella sp.]|jgi:hypothetical protein|nr:hypothetical protein [Tannerella sp.]
MKRKLLVAVGIVAFATVVALNINARFDLNGSQIDVAFVNAEALVSGQCTGGVNPCAVDCPWEYCGYCSEFGYLQQCDYCVDCTS